MPRAQAQRRGGGGGGAGRRRRRGGGDRARRVGEAAAAAGAAAAKRGLTLYAEPTPSSSAPASPRRLGRPRLRDADVRGQPAGVLGHSLRARRDDGRRVRVPPGWSGADCSKRARRLLGGARAGRARGLLRREGGERATAVPAGRVTRASARAARTTAAPASARATAAASTTPAGRAPCESRLPRRHPGAADARRRLGALAGAVRAARAVHAAARRRRPPAAATPAGVAPTA